VQLGRLGRDEAEAGLGPQAQHFADAANLALLQDEIAQRTPGDRFQLLADRHLRPLQGDRRVAGLLNADTETDIEEVRVVRAALPHPRAADHGVQLLRVAVDEQLAAPLILCSALHFLPVIVELAQIDAPLLFLLTPGDSPSPSHASAEHQRTEPGQTHHREKPGLQ
jgi:hypothetical protein